MSCLTRIVQLLDTATRLVSKQWQSTVLANVSHGPPTQKQKTY